MSAFIKGVSRHDLLLTAEGVIAETLPRQAVRTAYVMVTGTVYYTAIPLLPGDVIANLSVVLSVAGTLMTLTKVGLYDQVGNRLALSADVSAAWATTGLKTHAMIAPFTVQTAGLYYAAAISVFTGIAPNLNAGNLSGITLINSPIGAGALPWGIQLAQADLPNPGIIVVGAASLGAATYMAAS